MSNPALILLDRTETNLSALLAAGLATGRGGREEAAALAAEASALKLERLSAELRKLSGVGEPAQFAAAALTALALCRKMRERLLPWPELDQTSAVPLDPGGSLRLVAPAGLPEDADLPALVRALESGDALLRAYAMPRLAALGEAAVPELARLARKAPLAVRRAALRGLGASGGPAALRGLLGALEDDDAWRALLEAIRPQREAAVPLLTALVAAAAGVKGKAGSRLRAITLLYRLGAYASVLALVAGKEEDHWVRGLVVAARARLHGGWEEPGLSGWSLNWGHWESAFLSAAPVALARAEVTGDVGPVVETLDKGAVNEVRPAVSRLVAGGPLEPALAQHYLRQLGAPGAKAKDRKQAAAVLRGLASPAVVPTVVGLLRAGEVEAELAVAILGAAGGDHALGVLLDLAADPTAGAARFAAFKHLDDPGAVPALLNMMKGLRAPGDRNAPALAASAEVTLAALGDSAVDEVARAMAAEAGAPLGARLQSVLLQMKTPRAKAALKTTDANSPDALFARLGHARLGVEAAKAIARLGESALERLEGALRGSDYQARLNALTALGGIKSPQTYEIVHRRVAEIVARPTQYADWEVVKRGLKVLTPYGDPRNPALFVGALQSTIAAPVEEAVEGLVAAGPSVVPLVLPLLSHPQPQTRAAAAQVLGKLGAVAEVAQITPLLRDGSPIVKRAALMALGNLIAAGADRKLIGLIGEVLVAVKDWFGSQAALETLRAHAWPEGIPYLKQYAKRHSYQRDAVVGIIREIEAANPAAKGGLFGKLRGMLGGNA